jgi:Bacterial low temperature requirement A protein (LtrA)
VIWFPPGEKHWHGATATMAMTHIAIQEQLDGKTVEWMERVSDEQYRLAEATGAPRAAFARDAYSYLHLPMVAGIVLFAFGLKTTLADVDDALRTVPALGLCGGVALYLLAHVTLRLRIGGGLGRGRPVATVLLLGLLPVARTVPALTALGLVAAVCAALIAYEALRHREERAWIRSRRGAFTMEEASRVESSRRRDRRPRAGGPT